MFRNFLIEAMNAVGVYYTALYTTVVSVYCTVYTLQSTFYWLHLAAAWHVAWFVKVKINK